MLFQQAKRVLEILKLDDLVEGIVYCDYRVKNSFVNQKQNISEW